MTENHVSPFQAADINTVARIHRQCFDDAWSSSMIRRILSMPGAFGFVVRDSAEGSAIGFAMGRVVREECELLSIGVAPDQRSHGYGAQLLEATIARAASENAKKLFLEVAEDNEVALKLYAGHGLVAVGRRPDYYQHKSGGATAALTMRCDLPTAALDEG